MYRTPYTRPLDLNRDAYISKRTGLILVLLAFLSLAGMYGLAAALRPAEALKTPRLSSFPIRVPPPPLQFHLKPKREDVPRLQFVARWQFVAVQEMEDHGIPASVTAAQAILESLNGTSYLATEARAFFGVKCWPKHCPAPGGGHCLQYSDDAPDDRFVKYTSVEASFGGHSRFLKRARYAGLFELGPLDWRAWIYGLSALGYATDRGYSTKLISLVSRLQLHHLDEGCQLVATSPSTFTYQ